MSLFGPRKSDASPGKVSPGDVFDYERAKNDPIYFAERFIRLEGYQKEALSTFQKRLLMMGNPIILKSDRGSSYAVSVHQHQIFMRELEKKYGRFL